MSETEIFTVGDPLPRIKAVSTGDGLQMTVTWADGPRASCVETIDLAPAIYKYKNYAPLRDNPDLFRSAHVVDEGFAIAWGGGEIDMASTTIEELAEETMASADFVAFIQRHKFTLEGAAAQLGISRRQVAYYAKSKTIPRYIALACAYLDGMHHS